MIVHLSINDDVNGPSPEQSDISKGNHVTSVQSSVATDNDSVTLEQSALSVQFCRGNSISFIGSA